MRDAIMAEKPTEDKPINSFAVSNIPIIGFLICAV